MNNGTSKYKPVVQYGMEEIKALKPVINTDALCGIGGFSHNKALALLKSGVFKSAKKVGRTWALSKAEVLEYFGVVCE